MDELLSIDVSVFRFINLSLSNSFFDRTIPFFSGNALFIPAIIVIALLMIWKGGVRGRLCAGLLLLIIAVGDPLVFSMLKKAIGRPRPFQTIVETHMLAGPGRSYSMPSGHSANWFAATMVAYVFYRRSIRFMVPLACLVGFSRIYVGVHYPSDVFVGAIVGAGYAIAALVGLDLLWQLIGSRWFSIWWRRMPSLLVPVVQPAPPPAAELTAVHEQMLKRLGYLLIFLFLAAGLGYLAAGRIELSEDEAYQWHWSKQLALSYYSKPPLIACTQFVGTTLWGDTEFGVRFFSPVIAAMLSILLFRFLARNVGVRPALVAILIIQATPLLAAGETLMTIDPLLALFWTAAMIAGWRAVQPGGTTRDWLWVGCWSGLAFLSKYSALFQWLCWIMFFVCHQPARQHLRRPGPYAALLVNALFALPVILWNAQHDWVTLAHVTSNAARSTPWEFSLRYLWDFVSAETVLLNPVFVVAMVWAMIDFWRRSRSPLALYFFSMGAPLFAGYLLFTFYKRVFPNWIAPAVLPLFCLMVVYWYERWRSGAHRIRRWLASGCYLGFGAVILLHETDLVAKIVGQPLPPDKDPLRRVRAWKETARLTGELREQLAAEGKPAFIIGSHYGIASEISFYLPAAKSAVPDAPLVYPRQTERPQNQFFFWPQFRYRERRQGQNAIYVQDINPPRSSLAQWVGSLLAGRRLESGPTPPAEATPKELLSHFVSVKNLGMQPVLYRGRVFRWLQVYECRDLR
jgi:membrane-associated phospholipid phosphatase